METISITTESKQGKLTRNRSLIMDAINYFDGHVFEIVFRPKKKQSSDPQRSYYWAVIVPLFRLAIKKQWGEIRSDKWVNEMLKGEFAFKEKVNEETGQVLRVPISPTSDMSTSEREDYHTQCRQLALEYFGVTIPLPNEQIEIEL